MLYADYAGAIAIDSTIWFMSVEYLVCEAEFMSCNSELQF